MAAINTQKFCDDLADRPDWDASKIARLQLFLRKEGAWGDSVSAEKLGQAISRFVQVDGEQVHGVSPPEDAPTTDTS